MKLSMPPMGWNSWDCYGAAVTEETVRKNAEYMAKHLRRFGWEYVVVDIQWYEPTARGLQYNPFADLCMDEYGRLIPAENRFPSAADGRGFASLAEYVHGLGLKFGIHIMRGIPRQAVYLNTPIKGSQHHAREIAKTDSICTWNTDMLGVDPAKDGAREYYDSLFALYASWGVDFIKCDDICRELPKEEGELELISSCLRSCGRDMVLSLSPGPALLEKAELYKRVSDMWRITDDFWDKWEHLYAMFERAEHWCTHSGSGHWPDADMLPVGAIRQAEDKDNWTRFTHDEQITMLTLWSIIRSPLMIGGDLTKLDDFTLELLTNERILDMHRCARHPHQLWRRRENSGELAAWVAACSNGGSYAALFNLGDTAAQASLTFEELELSPDSCITELWTGKSAELDVLLPPHSARAYLLRS